MVRTPPAAARLAPSQYDVLDAYFRAANYLAAAQLYLRSNVLLRHRLHAEELKQRPGGRWETQPGLNLIYAHLNRLIIDTDAEMLLVVGPGRGAPEISANLYLEGTLGAADPALTLDESGLVEFVRRSLPTPAMRGAIHEVERGYGLAHAFGAALDNPRLLAACIISDDEAESGPLAAAWNGNRFLDPRGSGAVLPILLVDAARRAGPTVLGRMSKSELIAYVEAHGYEALYVDVNEVASSHVALAIVFDRAYEHIIDIQNKARSGERPQRPRWPCIIVRVPGARPELRNLPALETWLRSYVPDELFDVRGAPRETVLRNVPRAERRIGRCACADPGYLYRTLELPPPERHALDVPAPGRFDASAPASLGRYLRDVVSLNARQLNFRIFSADESLSDSLAPAFEVTERASSWPLGDQDAAEGYSPGGRIVQILSAHACEGWLEGYLLTGRHGVFVSGEAPATIVDAMFEEYGKRLELASDAPQRSLPASLNLILTSADFALPSKRRRFVRAYFPPDANTMLACARLALRSRGSINAIVAPSHDAPQWLALPAAERLAERGAALWEWASTAPDDPEIVLACAGDVCTLEMLAAAKLLHDAIPELRVRFVNVVEVLALGADPTTTFAREFGESTPVIFAYPGPPDAIGELVYRRPNPQRFHIRGFLEEEPALTPFERAARSGVSRYHLADLALQHAAGSSGRRSELSPWLRSEIAGARAFAREHGVDAPQIARWKW